MTVRLWLLMSTAVPPYLLSPINTDRVLNMAAHTLWPTLASLVERMTPNVQWHGMVAKMRRGGLV